jgi:energy-coupling factor transport system substrate-specific component
MTEQEKVHQNTSEITHIGMSVALLIAGGVFVIFLSRFFPIPGTKYLLMGTYISLIMSAMAYLFPTTHIVLKINVVLAAILSMVTIYMGIAILITGLAAELIGSLLINKSSRGIAIGMSYAGFTVLTSLIISKFIIGDALFAVVDGRWILITVSLASILGGIGGSAGKTIGIRVKFALNKEIK